MDRETDRDKTNNVCEFADDYSSLQRLDVETDLIQFVKFVLQDPLVSLKMMLETKVRLICLNR